MTTKELKHNQELIIASKRQALQERKNKTPLEAVIAMATMQRRPRYILNQMIDKTERVALIGQITRSRTYDPVSTALRFMRAGANAVSFFTDSVMSYSHDLDDLLMVAMGVKRLPVICQNYIVDEYHAIETRAADASSLVLYSSALDADTLRKVSSVCQRWKMSVIIQVNTVEEMQYAAQLVPHAIAIGNSESRNLSRTIEKYEELRPWIPFNTRIMFMDSLQTLDEVEMAVQLGVDGVIVSDSVLDSSRKLERLNGLLNRS